MIKNFFYVFKSIIILIFWKKFFYELENIWDKIYQNEGFY